MRICTYPGLDWFPNTTTLAVARGAEPFIGIEQALQVALDAAASKRGEAADAGLNASALRANAR